MGGATVGGVLFDTHSYQATFGMSAALLAIQPRLPCWQRMAGLRQFLPSKPSRRQRKLRETDW
jgi:hypothetical protein